MDTSEIHGMQDWQARILGALRTSKVMLVCLSPNYLASEPCRWEWQEYLQRQARMMARAGAGDSDDGTIAPVFFVDLPEGDTDEVLRWREQVTRGHGIDLRPWFPDGAECLSRADVRRRVAELGTDIWQRLERASRAESAVGNLLRFNPYFVGRTDELDRLNHAVLAPGSIGVVTAVHGLGGLGKTELAVQYAHAYRDRFAAGIWQLRAEGHREMLPLIGTLADEPMFDFVASKDAHADPSRRGREVLAELLRRGAAADAKMLLILDNVSEPALLAEPQVAQLPKTPDLVLIATTRLGEPDFPSGRGTLGFLELGELSDDAALALIRDHQPQREDGMPGFASQDEEQAAVGIVAALGGFTLAVEQAAVYLGRQRETAPSDFLKVLHAGGITASDAVVAAGDGTVGASMRHQQRTLAAVLGTTLADLDAAAVRTLRLASLLPPDTVPWPWLAALVGPDLEAASDDPFSTPAARWGAVRRILSSRRLLTPAGHPDLARMHRLVGAHLAGDAAGDRDAVQDLLVGRAEAINGGAEPPAWEYGALLDALLPALSDRPDLALRLNLDADVANFSDRLGQYVGDDRPRELAAQVLAQVQQVADARPGNLDAQRDLSISLNNVARLQEGTDPAAALLLYQQSLTIAQQVADARPGNLDAQQHLAISLDNVAGLQQGTDPAAALALYRQSLAITEQVADARPGNLDAQRELAIGLINIAVVLERIGTSDDAKETWQRACRVMQGLARVDALGPQLGPLLAVVCSRARG